MRHECIQEIRDCQFNDFSVKKCMNIHVHEHLVPILASKFLGVDIRDYCDDSVDLPARLGVVVEEDIETNCTKEQFFLPTV